MYSYVYSLNRYIFIPANPKVVHILYSADLSAKNVFVEAQTYLFVFLWVHVVILSDSFGS